MRLVACSSCHAQFDATRFARGEFRCHCGAAVSSAVHAPVEALVHRCGSCGAAVGAEAKACDYCKSAIVRDKRKLTLICPGCYARNSAASRFCTHCGVEFKSQPIPGEAPELPCAHCDETLMILKSVGGVGVHECPTCSGLWVPGDHFDQLVNHALDAQRALPSTGLNPGARPARHSGRRLRSAGRGPVVYRRCPVCRSPMHRKNFARKSGVIVDWCGEHGTWLDPDELEEIARFVTSGGWARAAVETAAAEAREAARDAERRARDTGAVGVAGFFAAGGAAGGSGGMRANFHLGRRHGGGAPRTILDFLIDLLNP